MKIFLSLGPGDLVTAARARSAGKASTETSLAYSDLVLTECKRRGIPTLATSYHAKADAYVDGCITVKNCPRDLLPHGGVHFHLTMIRYAFTLVREARAFGATVAVIDSGAAHYFMLTLFRLMGISVAVNLHNVLWPEGYPPRGMIGKTVRWLNGFFFRHVAVAGMGVSPTCAKQVLTEAHHKIPFFQYLCQFSPDGFTVSDGYQGHGPFRVIAVGRLEAKKGFLDLVPMALALRKSCPTPFVIDVCGDGPVLQELRGQVEAHKLHDCLVIHGRLQRAPLLAVYAAAHAVIVPTKSTFTEGMPHVCAEGALSGLPVIANDVSNAFDVMGEAMIHANTDDPESFAAAIVRLITEPGLYAKLKAQCAPVSRQFVDRKNGYDVGFGRFVDYMSSRA
jgi:glycogen synthase